MRKRVGRPLLLSALLAAIAPLRVAASDWVAGDGDWNSSFSWSRGLIPNGPAHIDNGGTARVTSKPPYAGQVTLGTSPGQSGNLIISNANFEAGGILVGEGGFGTVLHTGGAVRLDGSSTAFGLGLVIGVQATSLGTYTLTNPPMFPLVPPSTLLTHGISIGQHGTFNHLGGTVESIPLLGVGAAPVAVSQGGLYRLDTGLLTADLERVGGHFQHDHGRNVTGGLEVDEGGTYHLVAGDLRAGKALVPGSNAILSGVEVQGRFEQSGGTVGTDWLSFHNGGFYELSGGAIDAVAGTDIFGAGPSHVSRFRHTGGSHRAYAGPESGQVATLLLGRYSAYEMDEADGLDNPAILTTNRIRIDGGDGADEVAVFRHIAGGVNADDVEIGQHGSYQLDAGHLAVANTISAAHTTASFTQSGGTATSSSISIDYSATVRLAGGRHQSGLVSIYDGTLDLEDGDNEFDNIALYSGKVRQGGGLHRAGDISIGDVPGQTARYELGGGVMNAGPISIGRFGAGTLDITGGALNSLSATVGGSQSGNGAVTVRGADARWTIGPTFSPPPSPADGQGSVSISGGGRVRLEGGGLFSKTVSVGPGGDLRLQSDAAPALVHADTLTISSGGRLSGSGLIGGRSGPASSKLTNHGALDVQGTYVDVGDGRKAQLVLRGDFDQRPNARMSLVVQDANRKTDPAGSARIPLIITGSASFDGELHVDSQFVSTSQLDAGDRFRLIEFNDVRSRFKTFTGTQVQGRDDLFFGLNYTSDGRQLDLITLQTPRLLTPNPTDPDNPTRVPLSASSNRNLALLTHGWNMTLVGVPTSPPATWPARMGSAIASHAASGWDVATLDWTPYALAPAGPEIVLVAANAVDIGESLHHWLREKSALGDLNYVDSVHLIGHSAGSWLVDGLADRLSQDSTSPQIHLSLLDAFHPTFAGLVLVPKPGAPLPELADSADFAEHFVDTRPLLYTNERLANAYNVDVTQLGPSSISPVAWHAWPYEWYRQTVGPLPGAITGAAWGFPSSSEYDGGPLPSHHTFARGGLVVLTPDGAFVPTGQYENIMPIKLKAETSVVSDTGVVTFADDAVTLATGSPVTLTSMISLSDPATTVSFDLQFLSAAGGLLSLYIDGDLLISLDSVFFRDPASAVIRSGDLWLNDTLPPGIHTMIWRLDPTGDGQGIARISNISFARPVLLPVPEPSAPLVILAWLGAFARRRKRKVR